MLRDKDNDKKIFYNISLDDLVPIDHFLRQVDHFIDFSFIRTKVKHLYSHTGKAAIDPVVLFKMLLIGYLYDIKSERQLEKEIQVNLAYRWFIRYDLDERIPDHSTISQTRRRRFIESSLFQDIFDEIVRQCIAKGLITGKTILTDSTLIRADASLDSLKEVLITPQEFIQRLEENSKEGLRKDPDTPKGGKDNQNNKYSNDTHRSKSDPDSRIVSRKGFQVGLYYKEHRSIDSHNGYITDVFITTGTITDSAPYLDRLKRQQETFSFPIQSVVADRGYGIGKVYKDLTDMRIEAYIPEIGSSKNKANNYRYTDFTYDKLNDRFICPSGHILKRSRKTPRKTDLGIVYKASRLQCDRDCPNRGKCMSAGAQGARQVQRNVYQDYIDYQLHKKKSPHWQSLLRKRKTMIEGSFADAKENHGMRRAKFRGLSKVKEQSFMTAIAQNIKKMVKDFEYDTHENLVYDQIYNGLVLAIM